MIKNNRQKGQVIIINTLLFFALSSAIIFALTTPVISSFNSTKSFSKSTASFLLANSAVNEGFYKLNSNKNILSTESLSLAQGEATIFIADNTNGKTISVLSDVDSYQKKYELQLIAGSGVSFNYGLQVGQGGFEISGGSGIYGNVYANGDIVGNNGAFITGTAVSANVSNPITIASNVGDINPPSFLNFGGNSTSVPQDVAQSFTVSTTTPISSIRTLIKKTDNPTANIVVRITTDDGGKPSKNDLAQAIISTSIITSNFGYITIPFSNAISLNPNLTYWLVFDSNNFSGPYYSIAVNDGIFASGLAKFSQNGWSQSNGGIWNNISSTTMDIYFDIYGGGNTGVIDTVTVGTNGVGDAWSYEVKNSTVAGTIYCQTGTSNDKNCNTSRSVPVPQAFPISEGNIIDWKNEAINGGTTSTPSYGSGTYYLGPTKINGDLSIGSGGILNLNGTVYVTGNILVNGGGIIRVNPTFTRKSAVLLTDGTIKSNGGGQFQGSGANGSYILLVTTSSCPNDINCGGDNAVEVSGGTGAVVINAQNGTLEFSGGAQAKQATAHKIIMTGGTSVTYESGLVNPVFSSGPSGAWNVESWKEIE